MVVLPCPELSIPIVLFLERRVVDGRQTPRLVEKARLPPIHGHVLKVERLPTDEIDLPRGRNRSRSIESFDVEVANRHDVARPGGDP